MVKRPLAVTEAQENVLRLQRSSLLQTRRASYQRRERVARRYRHHLPDQSSTTAAPMSFRMFTLRTSASPASLQHRFSLERNNDGCLRRNKTFQLRVRTECVAAENPFRLPDTAHQRARSQPYGSVMIDSGEEPPPLRRERRGLPAQSRSPATPRRRFNHAVPPSPTPRWQEI